MTRPETAIVTIHSLSQTPVKHGLIRYSVSAERVDETDRLHHWIALTTLNEWKASLCDIARQRGTPIKVTFRETGYFDKDIVSVAPLTDEQVNV